MQLLSTFMLMTLIKLRSAIMTVLSKFLTHCNSAKWLQTQTVCDMDHYSFAFVIIVFVGVPAIGFFFF